MSQEILNSVLAIESEAKSVEGKIRGTIIPNT